MKKKVPLSWSVLIPLSHPTPSACRVNSAEPPKHITPFISLNIPPIRIKITPLEFSEIRHDIDTPIQVITLFITPTQSVVSRNSIPI